MYTYKIKKNDDDDDIPFTAGDGLKYFFIVETDVLNFDGDCWEDCNTDASSIFVFAKISSVSLEKLLLQYNDLVLEIY